MKTKLSRILTLLAMLIVHMTYAQEKIVTGSVTDGDGVPLLGATIIIDGSSSGTTILLLSL